MNSSLDHGHNLFIHSVAEVRSQLLPWAGFPNLVWDGADGVLLLVRSIYGFWPTCQIRFRNQTHGRLSRAEAEDEGSFVPQKGVGAP